MLIDDTLSKHCEVKEIAGVPSPGSSPKLAASEAGVVLTYHAGADWGHKKVEVAFKGCFAFSLGVPNDEALHGHRLWGKGLQYYSFHEVIGSDWIADMMRRNRVHHRHSDNLFSGLRHFIITFQDMTFECVAHDYKVASIEQEAGR